MKNKFKSLAGGLAVGLALLAGTVEQAWAGFDFGTFTNALTATGMASNVVSTAASQAFTLHPGSALVICPHFNGVGNSSNVIYGIDFYNGQNWTTTPLMVTNTPNGTGTNVVGLAVFTKAQLEGFSQARWDYTSIVGGTNYPTGVDYEQQY